MLHMVKKGSDVLYNQSKNMSITNNLHYCSNYKFWCGKYL